jgi:flagellar protein FlaF
MLDNAQKAYEIGARSVVSNRERDATALSKAALKLEACVRHWDDADRATRLDEALRYNLRLWTLFQCELAQPNHEMVPELRSNLLSLSAFVDRCTFDIMARPEVQKLQTMIDINRNIALGLCEDNHPPEVR